jgi:hypothetical protein
LLGQGYQFLLAPKSQSHGQTPSISKLPWPLSHRSGRGNYFFFVVFD